MNNAMAINTLCEKGFNLLATEVARRANPNTEWELNFPFSITAVATAVIDGRKIKLEQILGILYC